MSFTHKIPIPYDFLFPIEHKNNVECTDHLFAYNESKWGSRLSKLQNEQKAPQKQSI